MNIKLNDFKYRYDVYQMFNIYFPLEELKFSEYPHFGDDTIYTYGTLLTSKINGNQLFFPMGSYKDSESHDLFNGGLYWTSDIKYWPCTAYIMCCSSSFIKILDKERYCGLNIRPVINL